MEMRQTNISNRMNVKLFWSSRNVCAFILEETEKASGMHVSRWKQRPEGMETWLMEMRRNDSMSYLGP